MYIGFDIEIWKIVEDGHNLQAERPLGISCASLWVGDKSLVYYNGLIDAPNDDKMSVEQCKEFVNYMLQCAFQGHTIVTWNGLQFDFDILAEESGMFEECKELAMNHVDLMFIIACTKGYPAGLNAVSQGMGLSGKTEGMHGDLAPVMWRMSTEDRYKVLEYVGQDTKLVVDLAEIVEKKHGMLWTSKSGKPVYCPVPKLLTVKECLSLPKVDTSWMTNPKSREDYFAWTLR